MKKLFKGFAMSLSMFSIFPLPKPDKFWSDGATPFVVPFFPLVGAAIGGVWSFFVWLSASAYPGARPPLVIIAAIALVPFFLSGFIHTDGFLDTADAFFSRRPREEKIKILKDPNVGAFAAISLCVLFLFSFAAMYDGFLNISERRVLLILLPVVSRCAAGGALLIFKPISETGFAATFRKGTGAPHFAALIVIFAVCAALAFIFGEASGLVVIIVSATAGIIAAAFLNRQFGGISGDLCGAAVTVSELAGLVCLSFL